MPIYEYHCGRCGRTFEKLVFRHTDPDDIRCPGCDNRELEQLYSAFAVSGTEHKVTGGSGCGSCHSHNCGSCKSH